MDDQNLDHISEALRPCAVPIDSLTLDPANVREHPERSIEAIKGSIKRFRQQKLIVFDPITRVIRAGNGTWQAMKDLGYGTIAAVPSDLEGSELTAFAIADNRTAELSRWNYQDLGAQMKALREEGFDLTKDLGWAQFEYEPLLAAEWKPPALDPEPDQENTSQSPPSSHHGKTITVTDEQYVVILRAVEHVQNEVGEPKPTIGRCLELIAADYLSGCTTQPVSETVQ